MILGFLQLVMLPTRRADVKKRLLRWFFLNFLFASIPLLVVVVLRALVDQLSIDALQDNLSEILFFAITISVTTVGDIAEVNRALGHDDLLYTFILFLLFSVIWSTVLYAVVHLHLLTSTSLNMALFMQMSVGTATILFLLSTGIQVFLGKVMPSEGQ